MGYIEQTDVGNVYVTDINDWFSTLSNLNSECKSYTDSEIRYKEILAEHDKQIREETVKEFIKWAYVHGVDFSFMGRIDEDGKSDVPKRLQKIANAFWSRKENK